MPQLTLAQAVTVIDAALAKARALQLAQLTVAVLDAGGHLIALKREDGSGILRADIATAKAWGALGMASRGLAERAAKAPQFYAALHAVSQGRLIPGPGGVLARLRLACRPPGSQTTQAPTSGRVLFS